MHPSFQQYFVFPQFTYTRFQHKPPLIYWNNSEPQIGIVVKGFGAVADLTRHGKNNQGLREGEEQGEARKRWTKGKKEREIWPGACRNDPCLRFPLCLRMNTRVHVCVFVRVCVRAKCILCEMHSRGLHVCVRACVRARARVPALRGQGNQRDTKDTT